LIEGVKGELSMNDKKGIRSAYKLLRPSMFHALSREFLWAAESFEMKDPFSPVHYFLYCRSIELSLKAFLLAKGVEISMIKRPKWVGHDLERALEEAELRGILDIVEIACEEREELGKANYYYKNKQGFEYADDCEVLMRLGSMMPNLKVLSEFASMLVAKLDGVCNECMHNLAKKAKEGELYIKDE
jgi:hypothetical protein